MGEEQAIANVTVLSNFDYIVLLRSIKDEC